MVQRVAVIGAGVSGLSSIKCCLEEGLEPTCFERSKDFGGLWKFADSPNDGKTRVYKTLVTNVCKEMSCYSDYPFHDDYPNFMGQEKFWNYIREFAEHFDLLKYIRFQTTVCRVTMRPDFAETGQWEVVTETEGRQDSAVFDAVMICTGHYMSPNLPLKSFPGIQKFQGQILHSQEYKAPDCFQGKRVLVIGLGNTGGDIAVEVGRLAAQVLLSTRTGTWVLARASAGGYPYNMMMTRRYLNLIAQALPPRVLNWIQARQWNKTFNHELYGLSITKGKKPKLIINDELPSSILCGNVTMKGSVKEFGATSVVFEDGSVAERVDAVIFTTGYGFSFPFLDEPLRSLCAKKLFLYKFVFPASLERATLAIIGHVSFQGSVLVATELQARWATRVFKGLCSIPPAPKLMAEMTKKQRLIERGVIQDPTQEKPNYINYMDDLAVRIGVKPSALLFLTDPQLAWHVFFGPCTPYQYRLRGPGRWAGARQAILTQWGRTLKPLRTRCQPQPASGSCAWRVCGVSLLLLSVLLLCRCAPPELLRERLLGRLSPACLGLW